MAGRREKYPNTNTFTYYNANPKGKITCDCVARAICTGLNEPYNEVLKEMFEMQIKTGYEYTDAKCTDKYLESKGWVKHKQPRKHDNTKYTGEEFCKLIADKNKRYICNIGGHHVVAIVDKKVHDIWDSTCKCIGNYWTKG
jgi:hypothetical protein